MSKISQEDIAALVSETRPNIKKWIENPELMPLGVFKKLKVLGIDIQTQEWDTTVCEFCNGKGYRLTAKSNNSTKEGVK